MMTSLYQQNFLESMKPTRKTIYTWLLLLPIFLAGNRAVGQSALDVYIQQALESNVSLQQKELSYAKSLAVLKEAKAQFWPSLSIEARYSVARGGRLIEIPIGDLVNPVYQNLNLINEMGVALNPDYPEIPEYPQLENVVDPFLREQEHETKARLIQPVFNAAILHNHQIRKTQTGIERISVDVYKRELIKEVKTAYFTYLQAVEALELYQNTLGLVEENLRTTNSLFTNHKVTKDAVYAAEAQVKEIEQQVAEARKNEQVSKAYFNFLLNQPYETAIDPTSPSGLDQVAVLQVEEARNQGFQTREELRQLDQYSSLNQQKLRLDRSNFLPNLTLVADYGFQGTTYSFTNEDDYFQGSLLFSWKLFDKPSRAKMDQTRIEQEIIAQQRIQTQGQIGLQIVQATYSVDAAREQVDAAKAQVKSAEQAFRLVEKKYRQGQANLVSYTDARTRKTNAEQQLIIAKYNHLIQLADLERMTASYPIQ
jgi:outer membrane protein